jgi:hypothetical protein
MPCHKYLGLEHCRAILRSFVFVVHRQMLEASFQSLSRHVYAVDLMTCALMHCGGIVLESWSLEMVELVWLL